MKILWEDIAVGVVIVILVGTIVTAVQKDKRGPWYLGCSDGNKEYMMKVEHKPRVVGSIIYIDKDMFVTPVPGMTCRIVKVSDVEKVVDNGIKS